ncbi:UDP-glycosyltransferase UGT5-like [Daphnia pulicaria]|uniref:UDP-glycosyltransferase UGT5-like n=1 Tax=Daphnia pulicaria TaxID=35523 RepID=UPI001EEC1DB0|nr:UDP-glycosyltransferase UGT5-like [Daphnia pulicaria]
MVSYFCATALGFVLLVVSFRISSIVAHNILVLSPITTNSHSNFIKPVAKALADRGHTVTYWNGLPPDKETLTNPKANLNLLYSPGLRPLNDNHQVGYDDRPFQLLLAIPDRMATYCTAIYRDPVFHQLMSSTEQFDLLIIEALFNECVLPLVRKFDVPFVYMVSMTPSPWLLDAVGSSLALDHLPHAGSNYADEMDFWQRTYNTISGMMITYFHRFFVIPVVDRLASEILKLNNQPSVFEIQSEYMSLIISNTHFSINYQFPASPALIQAGGLHCLPSKQLPKDLESFVDGSGDVGFIIVSFGSVLRGSDISDHVRQLFLSTFSRLPQRIIWKWEEKLDETDSIPSNVKLLPWMPQQDLLGHPKIRLLITHGGLNSKQEAVYHGVPFIALPVFADQPINAQKAHDDGYAIRLDWDNLTEEILFDAIQRILSNSSYVERMNQVSALMRDQTDRPLDRAVYWIEYVIRHQGAPHLRSASRKLSLFQRCLIDVLLFTLFLLLSLLISVFLLCRLVRQKVHHETNLQTSTKKTD